MSKRSFEFNADRRALLEKMLKERGAEASLAPTIPSRKENGPVPLSFAQQRLWFLDQLMPENSFYNLPLAMRYRIPFNNQLLEKSINEVVRRHESLRTTFVKRGDQPVQQIVPHLHIPLPIIDLRKLPPAEREAEGIRLAAEEARQPFDLVNGPLLRTTLLQLGDADFVFLLTMHHIISDGWSLQVFARELSTIYSAFATRQPSPMPELPIQYPDYALWQRERLQGEVLERQLGYWKRQLIHLPVLQLPTDRPRPALASFRGDQYHFVLPAALFTGLKRLSAQSGTTLFMTLLAAFSVLLQRYSGQDDVVLGAPVAGRNRAELENLIGFFINTLVLRIDHSGNPTFRQLLERVREVTLDAFAHEEVPFEKLVEELHPERDLSRNPLCQIAFQLFNTPINDQPAGNHNPNYFPVKRGSAVFDLVLSLRESGDTLEGSFEFSTDLFDRATIARMAGHYESLLLGVVAAPDSPISSLPLLSSKESQELLIQWNDTAAAFAQDSCVHTLVERQAEQRPEALAVLFEGEGLTFAELNRRANRLAHYLKSLGVAPETLVGLSLHRSHQMITGLLGILKAGGAFVPLDPTYPRERLSFMIADAGVDILLTQQSLIQDLPEMEGRVICLDRDWDSIVQYSDENPVSDVTSRNLAYVIYTSGSTGRPKGVQVEHRGLINVAQAQTDTFVLGPDDRVLQFSSLNFDASIFEMLMSFYNGAALCLGSREELLSGSALIRHLRENRVSIVTLPPSVMALLPQEPLPDLQTITVAGEACPADLVASWASKRRFFNLYGPTEDTIWATFTECVDAERKPPIGRPIANTQVYVLDRYLNPVPIGIPGELYISGIGLARGYLRRPGLTAEKFIPNPFSAEPGARMYKTGDLVRYLPDGNIEFLGRIDHQVKLRGFRIELGEIEAVLSQYTGVREALVLLQEAAQGEKRLIGYLLANPDTQISAEGIRRFLRQTLPEYMVPSAFVILEAWPLTPNGKIDHSALLQTESPLQRHGEPFVAPQTNLEQAIAEVWQALLAVEQVGLHDNFFDLGGHSLLLAQMQNKLNELFGAQVSIVDLFRNPTVSSLAHFLSDEQAEFSLDHIHDRAVKRQKAIRNRQERLQSRTNRRTSNGQI